MSPKLDIRIVEGKNGLPYGVFERASEQYQGGRIIARFATLNLAERFVYGIAPRSMPQEKGIIYLTPVRE